MLRSPLEAFPSSPRRALRKRVAGGSALACLVLFFLIIVVPSPAYAYGDPTGGQLFQILAPLLAVIWGAWLIFANNVRKRVGNLFRWITGSKATEPAANTDPGSDPGPGPNAD